MPQTELKLAIKTDPGMFAGLRDFVARIAETTGVDEASGFLQDHLAAYWHLYLSVAIEGAQP